MPEESYDPIAFERDKVLVLEVRLPVSPDRARSIQQHEDDGTGHGFLLENLLRAGIGYDYDYTNINFVRLEEKED